MYVSLEGKAEALSRDVVWGKTITLLPRYLHQTLAMLRKEEVGFSLRKSRLGRWKTQLSLEKSLLKLTLLPAGKVFILGVPC